MISALAAAALAAPLAFVGATVHPVSGPALEDGVVVVDDGRITAVGARDTVPIPSDAAVHDVSGKHLVPGLVDTHSHIGGGRLHEHLAIIQPGVSAVDAIDPTHVSVARARAGGLTTVNVMPGSGRLVGGQTAYLKLRHASIVDDMLLCQPSDLRLPDGPMRRSEVCGGTKMANGTNPQGGGGAPSSRMGAAFLQRSALLGARERLGVLKRPEAGKRNKTGDGDAPKPDLEADGLAQVLHGERVVHHHTHRADDIVTVLRMKEEFGLDVVLHHVSEAWKVADAIAESGAPCSLIIVDSPGGKEEALEIRASNGRILEEKGVLVAFHTDDPITDSRLFLRSAGLAVRDGMSPEGALRALTLSGAEMMHLEDRAGSLDAGKDADLVVLSGPPLSAWTQVEQTWVEGRKVFDRAEPEDRLLATGGLAAEVSR